MTLIKSLSAANKSERDKFRIPHSVQQSIPIRCIYSDGIWQVGNKHSKTWRFSDVNYAAASDDDRRAIFLSYGSALNALPTDATAKITIINRRLNPADFEHTVLMKRKGDTLDRYRREYNEILIGKVGESNNLVQEKYITVSIAKRKIEETRAYFRRVDDNLSKNFGRLDSGARAVSGHDRLRLLHDFFRPGEEQFFSFDQQDAIRKGTDFRDLICPDGLQFKAGYYLFAILFLMFDVETVFLYPWAVTVQDAGINGLLNVLFFMLILILGLAYAWKKGALEWK